MDYTFEIACEKDDGELRELLARNPVPGSISLVYKREPSFFLCNALMGKKSDVFVGRHNGRLIGFGISSVLDCYVDGEQREIGYLHSLRIDREHRSRFGLLARGFKHFRELDKKNNVPFYLTTIIETNEYAIKIFTSRRLSIPAYIDIGRYTTFAICFRGKAMSVDGTWEVRRVQTTEDLDRAVDFLNKEARKKQFYPCISREDITGFPAFDSSNIYVAYKNDTIQGVLAKWDQGGIKQTVVAGYDMKWRLIKPLYNIVSCILRYRKLPAPGEKFNYFFISFVAVKNN